MSAYKMDMAQAKAALAELMEKYTVIAPVMADGKLDYAEISDVNDVVLDDRLPYKSPKEVVFPRVENVIRFLEDRVEEAQNIKPVLLVGVKPCDAAAMRVFDEVFTGDKGRFKDSFYINRRNCLTVVGMGCLEKKPGCFCDERGTDLTFSPDCDGFLDLVDGGLVYEPLAEKGAELFTGTEAEPVKHGGRQPEKLVVKAGEADVFTAMPWEAYAEGCIGCGTCTYICPTCHCFNLRDAENKGVVTRTRVWDSCMYPRFTLHAGGHNPRTKKFERFRQRVLHKYLYIPENYGYTACSGCGRCIRSCPGGLNIRNTVSDIMKRLEETKKSEEAEK
ncbi:MAG TPA: 4Fe-4S dicluster domain-containing protein [Anaerovoracaceae bacterium]|nr:4Fe-4S dicluster domain-containing protein [Anaerovoracaceae bacterium]